MTSGSPFSETAVMAAVERWLDDIVIGMGLCPFAKQPRQLAAVAIQICLASDELAVLQFIANSCQQLVNSDPASMETTLVVAPSAFASFDEYNQFLNHVDRLIQSAGYEGVLQVATFHPRYQFAGTEQNDQSNLTNCSPYPVFHLIREASLTGALSAYPDPESIPLRNVQLMESLDEQQLLRLFPYWKED